MTIKTGPEVDKAITDKVEAGTIERTSSYRYLGILVNEEGDLEEQKAKPRKQSPESKTIAKQIKIIGSRKQCGSESVRVQLELYRKCAYPAIYYGIHAWGKIKGNEAMEIERIQAETLK